jgi:hypothetical protein
MECGRENGEGEEGEREIGVVGGGHDVLRA